MNLKKEKETRLREFLTPEQQTKYNEIMDKKEERYEFKAGGLRAMIKSIYRAGQ